MAFSIRRRASSHQLLLLQNPVCLSVIGIALQSYEWVAHPYKLFTFTLIAVYSECFKTSESQFNLKRECYSELHEGVVVLTSLGGRFSDLYYTQQNYSILIGREQYNYPYLFTYKAHSVIRRTLNFWRRLWQVSKMKISPKYPVIRRTQNYGKCCWPHRCTYNNLLPKVTNYGASIFKTIAKESHMDNSIKVTLFNSLKSSFKAIERA